MLRMYKGGNLCTCLKICHMKGIRNIIDFALFVLDISAQVNKYLS